MNTKLIAFVTFVTYNLIIQIETIILTDGMRGIKIWCNTEEQFEYLNTFQSNSKIDFLLTTPTVSSVIVSNNSLAWFTSNLEKKQIKYEIAINDVKKHVEKVQKEELDLRPKRSTDFHDSFQRYNEIKSYLQNLAKTHKDVMTLLNIGKSYENRDILAVQISSGEKKDKKAILIEGGMHAREWISPSSALYVIQELVTKPENKRLFEHNDIYIIPLLNPDGYEFSHEKSENRFWRKTRSVYGLCVGIDPNRNFDFEWRIEYFCTDTYSGPRPFSESETIALKNFFNLKKNIEVYLTLHSPGKTMMYPWSYSTKSLTDTAHDCVAKKTVEKVSKIQSNTYEVGSIAKKLYAAYGSSVDWAYVKGGVKLSYVMELTSWDFGFTTPANLIKPYGQEVFEAVKIFVDYMGGKICKNH